MPDLKPCPFCGGKAAFVPRAVNLALQKDPSDPKFGVSVICGQCSAESANMIDEEHAARHWNRRAADGVTVPPPELTWLYTHCRALGMVNKSDSGKWEHDIALFVVELKRAASGVRKD